MIRSRPSKWESASGKVHRRRLRFWPNTRWETPAKESDVIMLCGANHSTIVGLAPKGARVTCGTCIKAANWKGHLRNG